MASDALQEALQLLHESKWAKLCVLLHRLKNEQPNSWQMIQEVLFRHASNHRQLYTLATTVECSIKLELSSCYVLIPGLSDLDK